MQCLAQFNPSVVAMVGRSTPVVSVTHVGAQASMCGRLWLPARNAVRIHAHPHGTTETDGDGLTESDAHATAMAPHGLRRLELLHGAKPPSPKSFVR